jgi:protoporphyrinogen oxidase
MPDVIILGGGLSGLAAAWELERHKVDYALVEVKTRLGGGIFTERRDGFVLDGGAFITEKYGDWAFLDELGLGNSLVHMGVYRDGELVAFRHGTQSLTDALAKTITHPIYYRMAASSIGIIEGGRCGVCLENGIMLDARAVIIALPARYAEHLLRSLNPKTALHLFDYRYDPVARVSLGYRASDVRYLQTGEVSGHANSSEHPLKFLQMFTHEELPNRIPQEYVLIRAGVRLSPSRSMGDAIAIAQAATPLAQPTMTWAYYWPEADPLTRYLPEHTAAMDALDTLLPPNFAIVGSDYRARRLNDQVEQGCAAARKVQATL